MAVDVLDFALAGLLCGLGVAALFSERLDRSIMAFVGAGLVASLIWARLAAPDIAIAEAAIGAGVTGALLLLTWQQ